ncbi:hypothetical protein H6S82_06650 [Planktothrix sp. FACHB-1355]|uniref:Uncharacterized protein n=1 Tax=Aerosakkonema funiforme FACHB-1375 TaxID=2949571 RepID=A0A926ZKG4_9CYAN|nr:MULTISPECIES: hypothetical protein [Oscillatoriales]MBD2183981.1 hypothetical protein [Aerosakkonema funiforme FACHB-1375]MBD3558535.1 hypothetical protein [Planktothrix sp. FACHB-1355]
MTAVKLYLGFTRGRGVCHAQKTFASSHHHILAPATGVSQLTNRSASKHSISLAIESNPYRRSRPSPVSITENVVQVRNDLMRSMSPAR